MRRRLGLLILAATLLAPAVPMPAAATGGAPDNVVLRWNAAALHGVRDSRLGPPMVARALAIVHTCIYDAWAAYDQHALGTQFGGDLRQPPSERRITNKN